MEDAVNVQSLINIGFSLFGILLGILITAIFKRQSELNQQQNALWQKHNELAVELPQNYVSKNDFRYMIDTMLVKLDKIETKLDKQIEKDHNKGV
jgi:hypothetical protein